MDPSHTRFVAASLLAVLATVASMHCIDKEVAQGIWQATSSHPSLHKHIKEIPNILPHLVVVGTAIMWIAYYAFFRRNGQTIRTQFVQLAATAVPTAFLAKMFLQHAFGRTNIRLWLRTGGGVEFRWFDPIEGGGFPSGHTIVFTAFFAAVWLHYPKYRHVVILALSALIMALLLTSYHFVSDIISGLYFGILITVCIYRLQSKPNMPTPCP